ncbi:MAG: NlpC/P60 family protein [Pseudomonadota bacterium]
MPDFDRRLTPARADLAADSLRGQIEAPGFAAGALQQVIASVADLRESPRRDSRLETQLLFGETFTVYDRSDGWAWGQSSLDSYVGYVRADALSPHLFTPTHRVAALASLAFPARDIKSAPHAHLALNTKVAVETVEGRFAETTALGWVPVAHLAPIDARVDDWVATAERFAGAPYLWGGKTLIGMDCSGLVQTALESAGVAALRDSDLQEAALSAPIAARDDLGGLQRGDLVFWKGHVGVMRDATTLLHANAFHMQVESEPLAETIKRLNALGDPITSIRRL